jgi:hypothetical protein
MSRKSKPEVGILGCLDKSWCSSGAVFVKHRDRNMNGRDFHDTSESAFDIIN